MNTYTATAGRVRRRKSLSRHVASGVLALLEGAIVIGTALALLIVYVIPKDAQFLSEYAAAIVIYTALFWQGLHWCQLYRLNRYTEPKSNVLTLLACIWLAFLGLIALAFAFKVSDHFSRVWAFSWMIGISLLVPMFRVAASRYIRQSALSGMLTKNIAIYGAGENCLQLIKYIESRRQPWLKIVGIFDDRSDRVPAECGNYPVCGGTDELIEFTQRHGCDEVLLAMPPASRDRYLELTNKLRLLPVNLRVIPDLTIMDAPNLPDFAGGAFGIPTIDLLRKPVTGWGAVAKRGMDILLTGLFCLAALPLIGVIALLIKLDSRGPVFFKQQRYGFQNEIIDVLKFRSMYVDCADANAEKLTTRDDPRVTRVGAWLRRFSLDELPQLFNVLKGDMSLIGPRPHALKAKAGGKLYQDVMENYGHRIRVKPGLTGWAQVNGWRGNTETEEQLRKRVEYDLYYIEHWSIMLDLKILFRTFWIVLEGENSY
jgi:Undecaprenyl-phosphate glucose phosphotransferase